MGLGIINNAVQFRGTAYNENGVPYYKSGKGTTAGVVMAVPAVAINLGPLTNDKERFASETIKFYETLGFKIDDKGKNILRKWLKGRKS